MIAVFDIGGTMIKYGVFDKNEKLIVEGAFPSNAEKGGIQLIESLCHFTGVLMENHQIEGIAISSAGQINVESGQVVFATDNIPGYTGLNPKKVLRERFGVPVSIDNDVNCFLKGEIDLNNYQGVVVGITLGTGIGGAIYANGSLLRGASYGAGEIGHIQLYKNGRSCTCGSYGCFEQYASTNALKRLTIEQLGTEDLVDFFERSKAGEKQCLSVLNEWVDDLTDGLKSIVYMFNPSVLVIGGAIAKQGTYLLNLVNDSLRPKLMPEHSKSLNIVISEHGNYCNLFGALSVYKGEN